MEEFNETKIFWRILPIVGVIIFLMLVITAIGFIPKNTITFTDDYLYDLPSGIEIQKTDPVIGESDAKVSLVLYSNFSCTKCVQLHRDIDDLVREFPNDIQFIWKDFPNPSLNQESYYSAIAARCAQNQGEFWPFYTTLTRYSRDLSPQLYTNIAKELDLNERKFINCFNNKDTSNLVDTAYTEAVDFGLSGAPVLFINGERFVETSDSKALRNYIESLLATRL